MINIINCEKKYNDGAIGISNVNISLENQGFVSIIGESGSGKSSLINCLGGLDQFTSGAIMIDDNIVKDLSSYATYVFQEAKLIETMTVLENLAFLKHNQNVEEIDSILLKLGILDLKLKKVNEISGGERQRVSLARALILDLPILICDEPTSSLDKNTSEEIFLVLKEISREKLVIVVSHNETEVMKYSDRILTISSGNIISDVVINSNSSLKMKTERKITLTNKMAFKISMSNIKSNIVKAIMSFVFLCFALFAIAILLNIVTIDLDDISYKAYSNDNMSYVQFNRNYNDEIGLSGNGFSLTQKTLNSLNPEYISYDNVNLCLKYNGNGKYFHSILVENNIINNNYILNTNEVYLSRNMFEEISDLDSLIGTSLIYTNTSFTIKGFLPKGLNDTILMSEKTFEKCNSNSFESSNMFVSLSSETYQSVNIFNANNTDSKPALIDGNYPIAKNEIALPYNIAKQLFGDDSLSSKIGSNISLTIRENSIYIDPKDGLFTDVDFVLSGYTNGGIVFADDYTDYYVSEYGSSRLSYGLVGGFFFDYNLNTFKLASSSGLYHQGDLSNKVYEIFLLLNSFKTILVVILIVFIVIAVLTIINSVSTSMIKNKKTLGIFTSFGIKKISLCKIYFIENLLIASVSTILAVGSYLGSILWLNGYFKKHYVIDFSFLDLDFILILLIIIVALIVISISIALPLSRLLKKKKIDILNEK